MKDEVLEKIETLIEKFRNLEIDFKKRYNLLRCIPTAKTTDLIEIKAFFSFLYLRGAINFRHRHCIFSWIHPQHFHCYDVKKSFQVLEQFIQFDDKIRDLKDGEVINMQLFGSFSLGCLAPQRLLVLIKHHTPIAGKLESNNTILQNLQSMDCYTEIYAMLKFHIYISRYRTMVNPTVLTMNISLQELMIIRSIMNLQEKIYRLTVILQVLS